MGFGALASGQGFGSKDNLRLATEKSGAEDYSAATRLLRAILFNAKPMGTVAKQTSAR
jgi:hypothetical protein